MPVTWCENKAEFLAAIPGKVARVETVLDIGFRPILQWDIESLIG